MKRKPNSCFLTLAPLMTLQQNSNQLDVVQEMRLLGVIVRSDMSSTSNTDHMVLKAYKKLWVMRRLQKMGTSGDELTDIYVKQVRSVLELAVPAWHVP